MIWAIIILGWALGRFRVLPAEAPEVLNRLVFYVANPCLMFTTLMQVDVRSVFGPTLAVAAISACVTALVFAAIAVFLRADRGTMVVGAMSSSLANAGHLGIPLATYILGSPSFVLPVLIFQLGFFSPMFFVLSDLASANTSTSLKGAVKIVVTNPLLISSAIGVSLNLAGVAVPSLVFAPIEVVAGAAVPSILIAFGLSLTPGMARPEPSLATHVSIVTVLKLVLQPLVAWAFAALVFGFSGEALFAAVAMAGLPTAQNAYVAAFRARNGAGLARGAVLATTILVTPTLMVIAALLA